MDVINSEVFSNLNDLVILSKGFWQCLKTSTWPNALERPRECWPASTTNTPSTLKQGYSITASNSHYQGQASTKMLDLFVQRIRFHVSQRTKEKNFCKGCKRKALALKNCALWRALMPTAQFKGQKTLKESLPH